MLAECSCERPPDLRPKKELQESDSQAQAILGNTRPIFPVMRSHPLQPKRQNRGLHTKVQPRGGSWRLARRRLRNRSRKYEFAAPVAGAGIPLGKFQKCNRLNCDTGSTPPQALPALAVTGRLVHSGCELAAAVRLYSKAEDNAPEPER